MKKYLFLTIITLLPQFIFADELTYNLSSGIPGGGESVGPGSPFIEYVGYFIPFLLSIAAILSLVMFVYGAIRYILSAGNPGSVSSAREIILNALMGLGLAVFSVLILQAINPKLVNLSLNIPSVALPSSPNNELTNEERALCATATRCGDVGGRCPGSCSDSMRECRLNTAVNRYSCIVAPGSLGSCTELEASACAENEICNVLEVGGNRVTHCAISDVEEITEENLANGAECSSHDSCSSGFCANNGSGTKTCNATGLNLGAECFDTLQCGPDLECKRNISGSGGTRTFCNPTGGFF